MLLPVTTPTEPGGSAGLFPRHLAELITAVVPPGFTGLPDRQPQGKGDAEISGPAVEISPTAAAAAGEPGAEAGHRLSRWEPVARALGSASKAIVGFLRSVGVPQADAEAMARRVAEVARERLTVAQRATQAHFEAGRLSLKIEDVHVGFRPGSDRADVHIGKAEIGLDADIPGAHHEEAGVTIGNAEAEIGDRRVDFAYKGPGATPAYADRGASGVSFDVAVPVVSPAPSAPTKAGPVDVAI